MRVVPGTANPMRRAFGFATTALALRRERRDALGTRVTPGIANPMRRACGFATAALAFLTPTPLFWHRSCGFRRILHEY